MVIFRAHLLQRLGIVYLMFSLVLNTFLFLSGSCKYVNLQVGAISIFTRIFKEYESPIL